MPFRQRPVTLSVCFAAFFCLLDLQVVNVSLPDIAASFRADASMSSLVVVAYTLALSSSLLAFGKLADRFGARKWFLLSHGLFLLGAVGCTLAPTLPILIACRFVQGIGGGGLHAISYTLLSQRVDHGELGLAFGAMSSAAGAGLCLGAPLGGLISGYLGWRWIFGLHLPLVLAAVWFLLHKVAPDKAFARSKKPLDFLGTLLGVLFVSSLVAGLHGLETGGGGNFLALGGLGGAAVSLLSFLIVESRAADPIADLSLFRSPLRTVFLFLNMCMYMLLAGVLFMLPFQLQWINGLATAQVGMVMVLMSGVTMFAGPVAGWCADRMDPSRVVAGGVFLCALACLTMTLVLPSAALWLPVAFLAVYGLGHGFFVAPVNVLMMGGAPEGSHGSISGLLASMRDLGSATGATVFAVFLSAAGPQSASTPRDFDNAWSAAACIGLVAVCMALGAVRFGRSR